MKYVTFLASLLALFSSVSAADRPNVLFIAIDDLRPELGTYGTAVKTPNFDRLAHSGMRFDRAYCQQAVCGASRLSVMSGLYPTMTQEQTFHIANWRERHPDILTMNQHFTGKGYHTVGLGKIYHVNRGVGLDLENWSQWINMSSPHYLLPESNAQVKQKSSGAHQPSRGPTTEMADVPDDAYLDGQRARKVADLLQQMAQSPDQPFYLAVGLTKPHLPFVAPKKYWDLYNREDFSMPANRGLPPGYPAYAANLQAHEMKHYSDYEGDSPADFSNAMNQRLLHGYAACVSYTDANLGVILDALEATGLSDNTIVVLWGDHGWKLGDHSSWCKHTNLECDTRVPLIIRTPGGQSGQVTSELVELIDLYPTLCDLTGVGTPAHCQGRSFAPLLLDANASHRDSAYSSYPANRNTEVGHSIRFGDYRYTEWRLAKDGSKTSKRVLTDLKADPGEVTNVIAAPEHAEALQQAEALLSERIDGALQQGPIFAPSGLPTLKEAAAGRFMMGVGVNHSILKRPEDTEFLKQHFDTITPEGCMKTTILQKNEGEFDFTKADEFVDYAEANGLKVVGHCLVWSRPDKTPEWFFKEGDHEVSKELLLERLRTHIHTVVGRYKGRIAMWDVVNEAIAGEYLRDDVWLNVLGEDLLVKAFQYAREADPDAMLLYNDYRCGHAKKLEQIVRMIKSVKAQGGPIDALGLQAHFEYGEIPFEGLELMLQAMRELDVKVIFSELDIDVVKRSAWYANGGADREEVAKYNPYKNGCPPALLQGQAEQYARLFSLINKYSDVVERVTFWKLHDGQSWLNGWPWERENHPLLFDRNRNEKPAYDAVIQSLTLSL